MFGHFPLRAVTLAGATAIFFGMSPSGAIADGASGPLPSNPKATVELPEMWQVPEAPVGDALRAARDWTGLLRIPELGEDSDAEAVEAGSGDRPTGTWLSELIERARGFQSGELQKDDAL